jgi:hypothetical protein
MLKWALGIVVSGIASDRFNSDTPARHAERQLASQFLQGSSGLSGKPALPWWFMTEVDALIMAW